MFSITFIRQFAADHHAGKWAARALLAAVVAGLLAFAVEYVTGVLPKHYQVRISGGDILSNRHFLTRILADELESEGIRLQIVPTPESTVALDMVSEGSLDIALIQGGNDANVDNVEHVATVAPEMVHMLTRGNITSVTDLKGKQINLGAKNSTTHRIAVDVLGFAGLKPGADFAESNFSNDDLTSIRPDTLPDAIVLISFVPSYVVDYLVTHGYTLIEMPFPSALSMRLGWVAHSKILAYSYGVAPAVPPKDQETVGVNLYMVSNSKLQPRITYLVLKTLFGPGVESRFKGKFDERNIALPSGFPMSQATKAYLSRNEPLVSSQMIETLRKVGVLVVILVAVGITLLQWLKWERRAAHKGVEDLPEFIQQVTDIEREYRAAVASGDISAALLSQYCERLALLKEKALSRAIDAVGDQAIQVNSLLLAITDARSRMEDQGSLAAKTAAAADEGRRGLLGAIRAGLKRTS